MQLVNGAQFLYITFLFLLVDDAAAPVLSTVRFPLTSTYVSLQSHKVDFNFVVLNLIWLLTLHVPLDSSFTSIQIFVLNLGA